MLIKTLLTTVVGLTLTGCVLFQQKPELPEPVVNPAVVSLKKAVAVDPKLLEECPDLVKVKDSSDEEILLATKQWLDLYQACRTRKSKLNILVKAALNTESSK